MNSSQNKDSVSHKINNFVSKFLWWLVGLLVMILGSIYSSTAARIERLEERVIMLQQDKVSRAELREVATELRIQNDTNKADIITQQNYMKADILSRLDYLLKLYPVQQHKD